MHRGEELGGLGTELHGHCGGAVSILGEASEAAAAGRDQGDFGHCEGAVDQYQQRENQDFHEVTIIGELPSCAKQRGKGGDNPQVGMPAARCWAAGIVGEAVRCRRRRWAWSEQLLALRVAEDALAAAQAVRVDG